MNRVSFDMEVLNGNTDYIYRLKQISDSEKPLINEFVHKMIINNYIKCLIPYTYEIHDDYRRLRYSVAPQTVLSDYLKNRFTDISSCVSVIVNVLKALKVTEEYMIDRRFVLLDADYMFINKSDGSISLMCLPINAAAESSLSEFMRSIIMPLNFEGLPGSDALKVTVYQYAFDSETLENAIDFFSEYLKSKRKPAAESTSAVIEEKPPIKTPPLPKMPSFVKETASAGEPAPIEQKSKNDKTKGERHSLFGGLFGSANKGNKSKPNADAVSNPFGINIPGNDRKKSASSENAPTFGGINIPNVKKEQPIAASVVKPATSSTMKIEEDERTIFETPDDGTVFLGESASRAYLKDNTGAVFEISGKLFTIGRSGKNGVKIDLDLASKTVSHLHATIYNENGKYFICDNGSSNGTFLNNKRLTPNEKKELSHGTRLRISNIDFTFEIA